VDANVRNAVFIELPVMTEAQIMSFVGASLASEGIARAWWITRTEVVPATGQEAVANFELVG
jgi:hypothetical protein